ncbi:hypothetical protein ABL78_5624 [Leptomonas seymouri]|uniref:Uncharacterized protein n=1 Tax=Leptomonas seymouri TaxID=5684 RepID=A0A0N1PBH0_LEPSE|nr:hypothetical protein ABL78_5624 [Leptomonas seymouri]|eukprot:KPI85312.1 hypothetical protein ABL78_5624 [Leptomonas seymouri]
MFRITWGRLGGGVALRRARVSTRSPAAVLSSDQKTRAQPVQRKTSRPVRLTSRSSSATRAQLSRRSRSPTAEKRRGGASDNTTDKAGSLLPAGKAGTSTSLATTKESVVQNYASTRPAYMSAKREEEVLAMAERMQRRDLTTEVPVASFAYEILKAHPSVRSMGLRERMDFLLNRWDRLNQSKKLEYINNPLRGLL